LTSEIDLREALKPGFRFNQLHKRNRVPKTTPTSAGERGPATMNIFKCDTRRRNARVW
jgi:hypothetical protein